MNYQTTQVLQLTEKGQIEARVVDLSEVYLEVLRVRRQIALAERNLITI